MKFIYQMTTHKSRVLLKTGSETLLKMVEYAKPINKSSDGFNYIVGFIIDATAIGNDSAKIYNSIHDIYFVNLQDITEFEKTKNPSLVWKIKNEDIISIELFIDNTIIRTA